METGTSLIPMHQKQWRTIFLIGGVAALLSFSGTVVDIILGSTSSADITVLPQTAVERFAEFNESWLAGLYHLDFLNVITAIIMIPAYFALVGLHRNKNLPYTLAAGILVLIGTIIFVSNNTALPMLELSNKYYAAADHTQRTLIAAAGEAMLAQGAHGSFGALMGFLIQSLAGFFMALVLLHGKIFGRAVSWLGVIGTALLLLYVVLVTFVPAVENIAVIMAAPGGLLALVWTLLIGVRLIKSGCSPSLPTGQTVDS